MVCVKRINPLYEYSMDDFKVYEENGVFRCEWNPDFEIAEPTQEQINSITQVEIDSFTKKKLDSKMTLKNLKNEIEILKLRITALENN